jgi:hypothetical protein
LKCLSSYLLRYWDRWQGTSWEKRYADDMAGRWWAGEENSTYTTLFSLHERGDSYASSYPGPHQWRDYGDIPWAGGHSSLHYDWVRHAFKHYLRTGNVDALRWGMAAARHSASTDFEWMDYETSYGNRTGYARYEKGDHGTYDLSKPTHTWVEGLFLAADVSGDAWLRDAALYRVEKTWESMGGASGPVWDVGPGEVRWITWPQLMLVRGFLETGDAKYWTKAKEVMDLLVRWELDQGSKGYWKHPGDAGWGNLNNSMPLMHFYASRALVPFSEVAEARGEWSTAYDGMMRRIASWLRTPVSQGGSYYPEDASSHGGWPFLWCDPG